MSKNLCPIALALGALAVPAIAQTGTQVVPPVPSVVYNGFSRGFSYTAISDHFIQDTELDATAFQAGDTGGMRVSVNGVEVFYSVGNAAGPNGNALMTPSAPIQVFTGDLVEVVGNWSPALTNNFSAHNSYGTGGGTYATTIEGQSTVLYRAGVQWDIGDAAGYAAAATFNTVAGSIGRSFIYTTPPSGLYASFDASPATGNSPLTVTFTDTSFTSDPGGVTSWAWDFDGDGNPDATTATATWVYPTCGSFDVELTVTDATNPASTTLVVGAVAVDNVVADFSVAEIAPGSGAWQFTDLSSPTPISWDWDFDGDGIVDDTTQSPVYFDPSLNPILDLPNCTLTVTGQGGCFTNTLARAVQATGYGVANGPLAGGNGTSAAAGTGTYWDLQVTPAEGANITGIQSGVYGYAGTADVSVYITPGTHVGKAGVPSEWTLAGTGTVTFNGTGAIGAPEFASWSGMQPFYLPPGDYGVAIFQVDQAGLTMQVSYTNGPGNAPYGNSDLVIHPNGAGCSVTTGVLGPCAFTPRLWNGRLTYETCSFSGNAAAGPFSNGCANSVGVVPSLSVMSMPQLGGSYDLELDPGLPTPGVGVLVIGLSKDLFNGLPLPLDLAILGAPGCNLATSADLTQVAPTAGAPAMVSIPIPSNPTLQCFQLYQQAAVLDPTANAFGFVLSNATAAIVGN